MGMFDVRCAETGLALRTERVALLLGLSDGKTWRPIALPIYGTYDSYGKVESVETSSSTRVIADAIRNGAKLKAPEQKKLDGLLEALAGAYTDDAPVKLGKLAIRPLFIERRVYDAMADAVLHGEHPAAQLPADVRAAPFDTLLAAELPDAVSLYEALKPVERRSLQAEIARFAAYRRWKTTPTPTQSGDLVQHSDGEIAARVMAARERFANVPRVLRAIDAYASEHPSNGEGPSVDPRSGPQADDVDDAPQTRETDGAAVIARLKDAVSAALSARGFIGETDGVLARGQDEGRVRVVLQEQHAGFSLRVAVHFDPTSGPSTPERFVRAIAGGAPSKQPLVLYEKTLEGDLQTLAERLDEYVDQARAVAGVALSRDRVHALAAADRTFAGELVRSAHISAETLVFLADLLLGGTYDETVRLAIVALLDRPDVTLTIAERFATHTSKSVKDAAGSALTRLRT